MDSPPLRQLDLFAQMVAAGSLSRCAGDLGIPAATIAQDMEALEMRLGYRLFDDLAGSARLTPAGRKTAQAMTLLSQDDPDHWADTQIPPAPESGTAPAMGPAMDTPAPRQEEEAQKAHWPAIARETPAPPARQTITLATPAPIFGHFQDALSAFEEANDDVAISLDLHVQTAAQATAALASGRADIAYFYALEAPADFPSRYGWSEQLNLYAGDRHPLAMADSVSRAMLAQAPSLTMERSGGMQGVIEAALRKGRAITGPAVLESDNMASIIAALRDGEGIFAAFGPLARDLGRTRGIRRLALDMPLPAIEVRQAVGPRAGETPAVEALAEYLFR